jgi:hypothetical protein
MAGLLRKRRRVDKIPGDLAENKVQHILHGDDAGNAALKEVVNEYTIGGAHPTLFFDVGNERVELAHPQEMIGVPGFANAVKFTGRPCLVRGHHLKKYARSTAGNK